MCGEKSSGFKLGDFLCISPPRVRGEEDGAYSYLGPTGITPACAGRSYKPGETDFSAEDHPRVCGEKCCRTSLSRRSWGSPPRVRGEAGRSPQVASNLGITPACAGRRSEYSLASCE